METSDVSPWPSTSNMQAGDRTSSPRRDSSARQGQGGESGSALELETVHAHASTVSAHQDMPPSSTDSLVSGQPPRNLHNRQPPPLKPPLQRSKDEAAHNMPAGMSPWPSATSLSSSTPAREDHVRNVQAELGRVEMRNSAAFAPPSPLIQAPSPLIQAAAQARAEGSADAGQRGAPPGGTSSVYRPCGPELAPGHRVSRPQGTGSVGDSVGEGGQRGEENTEGNRTAVRLGQRSTSPVARRSTSPVARLRRRSHSPIPPQRAPHDIKQAEQVGAWIENLSELLTSSLTGTLKEAASALEKALKTREGREALLQNQHGVSRLMACLSNEDDDEEERKSVVRCGSRALAALSMDSRGRRGIIKVIGAGSASLVRMSQLLRCNDVETAQCLSLIVGNLVCPPRRLVLNLPLGTAPSCCAPARTTVGPRAFWRVASAPHAVRVASAPHAVRVLLVRCIG